MTAKVFWYDVMVGPVQWWEFGLAERPRRRMPSAKAIAAYWHERADPFAVELDTPYCFRCRKRKAAWGDLERAHMVNRGFGGLDHEGNIAMLCGSCHYVMPNFEIDEWVDAALWILMS